MKSELRSGLFQPVGSLRGAGHNVNIDRRSIDEV